VHERERRAAERLGPSVGVLVAGRDLPAGARVTRGAVAVRRVPARFVPPDALGSAAGVVGARVAVPVGAGGYLSAGLFGGGEGSGGDNGVGRGERAVTVEVAGGTVLAGLGSGDRVDVLVSSESGAGAGRTVLALAGAELIALGDGAGGHGDGAGGYGEGPGAYPDPDAQGTAPTAPTALATLRVTVAQAVYLTAADNFAREVRLLPRPRGDHTRAGASVSQGQL
jgi:pilus assembly protein CpaB